VTEAVNTHSGAPESCLPPVYAKVALDTPLDRLFDYLALDATSGDIGRRVEAPFGNRILVGVLLALSNKTEVALENLKPLHAIDRFSPPLPPDLLDLARFVADYYHHPLGAVLATMLPPALRRTEQRARPANASMAAAYRLTDLGRAAVAQVPARHRARKVLAEKLLNGELETQGLAASARALLRDWLEQGWIAPTGLAVDVPASDAEPQLTDEQTAVLSTLRDTGDSFHACLLHGVTGSGKTEVYLQRVADMLAHGRQVLVLVPEIHLTPQLMARFASRFPGCKLIGLHSNLAEGERRTAWLQALQGQADIVLGTRLAIFTPLPRLGLIIVDEEHDGAYKQMDGMRYSARDVAVWRARERNIPVLLGSATPALESWRNAREGRYRLLSLTRRAHAQAVLPQIRLIDIRTDRPKQGLASALQQALAERLQRGEQSLVFINRRGYAPNPAVQRLRPCLPLPALFGASGAASKPGRLPIGMPPLRLHCAAAGGLSGMWES
jgi:primosomal protein N' (replication factor Y)